MRRIVFLGLLMVFFVTCKKDRICDCAPPPVDPRIDILYKDQIGQSLINSSQEFSDSNIAVYYKKDGFFTNTYDPYNSHKNFAVVYNISGQPIISVSPSHFYFDGNFSETMIELNPQTRDILRCEFALNDKGRTCKNVWFNGEKMDSTFFEVIH